MLGELKPYSTYKDSRLPWMGKVRGLTLQAIITGGLKVGMEIAGPYPDRWGKLA